MFCCSFKSICSNHSMWPFVAFYVPKVHGDKPPSLMVLLIVNCFELSNKSFPSNFSPSFFPTFTFPFFYSIYFFLFLFFSCICLMLALLPLVGLAGLHPRHLCQLSHLHFPFSSFFSSLFLIIIIIFRCISLIGVFCGLLLITCDTCCVPFCLYLL